MRVDPKLDRELLDAAAKRVKMIAVCSAGTNHIDLACWTCKQNEDNQPKQTRSLEEIIRTYDLTRREGEVLGLVFQDWNNEEILAKLTISKNTLLKHLQNLYRKCGVSSRWDLLKLRD